MEKRGKGKEAEGNGKDTVVRIAERKEEEESKNIAKKSSEFYPPGYAYFAVGFECRQLDHNF